MYILFVCTGNTCRSPMAEGLFRQMAETAGLEVKVESAGVSAMNDMPISEYSQDILKNKGIHQLITSSSISQRAVEQADIILTMTMSHKRQLIERFPDALNKVFTLKEYVEDNPNVHQLISEMEQLISELQVKQALSQEISDQERERLFELERNMPDHDIIDPIGGSIEDYQQCADEIEKSLERLLKKLKA